MSKHHRRNSGSMPAGMRLMGGRDLHTREKYPLLNKTEEGVQVMCPFCTPSHPILPEVDSPCGTTLKVTAIQSILTSHGARQNKIICIKCGKTEGGEMVRYMNGFVHIADCAPGTRLLTTPPAYSRLAWFVFRMPLAIRKWIEKSSGKAQAVKEIDPSGKETGRVLGYFFFKGTSVPS